MPKKKRTAYSLLELSIVIVIISILISGAMTTAVGNINYAKTKNTKDRLQVLYKALGNFIATNGRLPCPADITALKTSTNYGKEVLGCNTMSLSSGGIYVSNASNNLIYGMVPAVSLGLSKDMAEDGFEDKISYVVDKNFTASANVNSYPDFSQSNFSIAAIVNTVNNITVYDKSGSASIASLTNGAFILISHGPNKKGAYGINSSSQNAAPTDADEVSNYLNNGSGTNFDNIFTSLSENSDSFDDITLQSNPRMMVASFNLYSLLPCNNNLDTNYNRNGQADAVSPDSTSGSPNATNDIPHNAWFGQTVYGKACTGSDFEKNYSKKCGPIGQWTTETSCGQLP